MSEQGEESRRRGELGGILDVRTEDVFAEGHLAGAVNIPAEGLRSRLYELPPSGGNLTGVADASACACGGVAELLSGRFEVCWIDAGDIPADELVRGASRGRLWRPAALLAEWIDRLPAGKALDLGCGCGRDAVFLAEHGFDVLGVDRLPDALDQTSRLAERRGVSVRTALADLRRGWAQGQDEHFDVICCFYYLPRELFDVLSEALAPGGVLLIQAFTDEHAARYGRPRGMHRVVGPGELSACFGRLELLLDRRVWLRGGRHVCQFVARRAFDGLIASR